MSELRDERIVATAQRWGAWGLLMLWFLLITDLMVRALILKQDPRQYLDIALIWMGTMLFVAIGMTASGVAPYGGKWSQAWLAILIIAVEVPVVLTLMGMVPTVAHFIADLVIAAGGAFVMLVILRGICGVWERVTLGHVPREE